MHYYFVDYAQNKIHIAGKRNGSFQELQKTINFRFIITGLQ